MKKLVLVSAVVMAWSFDTLARVPVPTHSGGDNGVVITQDPEESTASATSSSNRDCVQYTGAQAAAATSDDASNTVGMVFSGKTSRKGITNADCGVATNTNSGNSGSQVFPEIPVVPTHSGGSND